MGQGITYKNIFRKDSFFIVYKEFLQNNKKRCDQLSRKKSKTFEQGLHKWISK